MMRTIARRSKDQRGFTLVEMITTMGVLGILMAIAIPTIQVQIAINDLRAAARDVTSVLRTTRDAAVNEGVPRYVLFTEPGSYRRFKFEGGAWVAESATQGFRSGVSFEQGDVTFPSLSNIPVSGASVPAGAAYFDTRGKYPTQTGPYSIRLRAGFGRTRTIQVHGQTGQVGQA